MTVHHALVLTFLMLISAARVGLAQGQGPVDRWAEAVGGRERIAAVTGFYREATVEVEGYVGTIKVWRTPDGKYRKEEQIATLSSVEVTDGRTAKVRQGDAAPIELSGPNLARARGTAVANSAAMFFAFFPERRQGTVVVEPEGTLVLKPAGGIDWRVTLDPQTSLPSTMVHEEGGRTVTVTFASYETIEGITFEKEIHRATPEFTAVIRFTKTVINPPMDDALFTFDAK